MRNFRALQSDTVPETPTIGNYGVVGSCRLGAKGRGRSCLHARQMLNFDNRWPRGDTHVYELEYASRMRRQVHNDRVRIRSIQARKHVYLRAATGYQS